MPNIKVTRAEFESYWVNRRRRKRRLDTLQRLLFGNGEDGFLFGNFAEIDELFTTSTGPTNVAANDDPVGLALDDHGWGGQTLAQIVAAAAELRGTGAIGLLGTATAATYNTGTGAGSATRVDVNNQSYVTFAAVAGSTYAIDITPSSGDLSLRASPAGAVLVAAASGSGRRTYYVAPSLAALVITATNAGTATYTVHSVKLIPGNHALQATTANRPLWKANAGKPYLAFDGTNDALIPPFYPMASGTGLTMAAAFNATNGGNAVIGGGNITGNKRAVIGLDTGGQMTVHWGTTVNETVTVDRRNANLVLIVTGDASGRDVWLNGVNVTPLFAAASGAPDGTGGALALGGRQNTVGGFPDRLMAGNISAALAMNRRVTPAEIARINSDFQRTF